MRSGKSKMKALINRTVVALACAGMLTGIGVFTGDLAQAGNRTCTVRYVVTKQWYECINTTPGLPGRYGCPSNPERVVTCSGVAAQ